MFDNILYQRRLIIIFLMLVSSCSQNDHKSNLVIEDQSDFCLNDFMKDDIKKVPVEKTPIKESILLSAKVEANPDKVVHFVSLVSGVVTKTYFSLGEEV